METDDKGVLAGWELIEVYRGKAEKSYRSLVGDYREGLMIGAEAQHNHDVAVVQRVRNPYEADMGGLRMDAWDEAKRVILAALKAEPLKVAHFPSIRVKKVNG